MIPATDPKRVSFIKKIDIPHWQDGATNFTACLLSLIQKAENDNKYKLSKIYSNEVEAFRQWEAERWADVHCEETQEWAEGNE